MGTLEASYFRIFGGKIPGGSTRRIVWTMAVIWANASSTLASGWKNTLMTATPLYDCDSICSISFTVVVMARSETVTIRFSISSGEIPLKDQTTLTTGISM